MDPANNSQRDLTPDKSGDVKKAMSPGSQDSDKKSTGSNDNSNSNKSGHRKGVFIIILLLAGLILFSRHQPVNTIDCTPEIIASKPDVIMLGAWWCTYCYQAKKYFQKNNISYCEYDMENTDTGRRLYQENGSGAVPILLIGEYRLSGYNESRIETALSSVKNRSEITD